MSSRRTLIRRTRGCWACAAGFAASALLLACSNDSSSSDAEWAQARLTSAPSSAAEGSGAGGNHPVWIRLSGPPRVDTGMLDDLGRPVTVSCMSCHSTQTPNFAIHSGDDLREFHQGLHMAHGGLSCLSCHNPDNYNALRLVDGRSLDYADVINLCAQCHAPQHRDFLHGAHGGMAGYWDLTRGPRTRLNCIDCHDPHAPAFPHMQPTFKPRDRFLAPPHEKGDH